MSYFLIITLFSYENQKLNSKFADSILYKNFSVKGNNSTVINIPIVPPSGYEFMCYTGYSTAGDVVTGYISLDESSESNAKLFFLNNVATTVTVIVGALFKKI